MSENSEHTVVIPAREMDALRRWMERPNGSSGFLGEAGRVTFEAVAGGGVMVRTRSYRYEPPAEPRRRPERKMSALADIMIQALISTGTAGAVRAQELAPSDSLADQTLAQIEAIVARSLGDVATAINESIHI